MDLINYTRKFALGTPIVSQDNKLTDRKLNPIDKRNNKTKFTIIYRDPNKKAGVSKRLSANNSLDALSLFRSAVRDGRIGDRIDKPKGERAFKYPDQNKDADRYLNHLNRLGNYEKSKDIRLQGISK